MANPTRAGVLKRIILTFWAVWISFVVLMNVLDALRAMGVLPSSWPVASGNYEAIAHVTSAYGTPNALNVLLFMGAIAWESVAALLFWRALRLYHGNLARRWRAVHLAFLVLVTLFLTFILMDELFHDYAVEGDHRGVTMLLFGSLLVLHLVPDRSEG